MMPKIGQGIPLCVSLDLMTIASQDAVIDGVGRVLTIFNQ